MYGRPLGISGCFWVNIAFCWLGYISSLLGVVEILVALTFKESIHNWEFRGTITIRVSNLNRRSKSFSEKQMTKSFLKYAFFVIKNKEIAITSLNFRITVSSIFWSSNNIRCANLHTIFYLISSHALCAGCLVCYFYLFSEKTNLLDIG